MSFAEEFLTLRHTEAMLLINDSQTQITKSRVIRNERVCADHEVHIAVRDMFFELWFMLGRSSQKRNTKLIAKQLRKRLGVLSSQYLSRRH